MSERTPLMVLEELAEKAGSLHYCDGVLSSRRRDDVWKSEQVGKLVEGLSDEDREILSEITQLLIRMNVAFLCVGNNGAKFITSDDPCILYNPKLQWQRFQGPGLEQRDIEVILPLSPEIMLCLSWSNFRGYIEMKKSKIDDLNRMTRAYCYKYFISHTPKTKWIWYRKYPLNLFFIIKVLKHRIKNKIQKIVLYYKYR